MSVKKIRAKVRDKAFEGLRKFNATLAKNHFGEVLAYVDQGEVIAISRHDQTAAVIMPASEYQRLKQASGRRLNLLTEEFDEMIARMQAPGAAEGMHKAFSATPAELGRAAVAAARHRNGR